MVEIARKYTVSLNPRYFRVGLYIISYATRGRRGGDRMAVRFTTTYAITTDGVPSNLGQGEVYNIM